MCLHYGSNFLLRISIKVLGIVDKDPDYLASISYFIFGLNTKLNMHTVIVWAYNYVHA